MHLFILTKAENSAYSEHPPRPQMLPGKMSEEQLEQTPAAQTAPTVQALRSPSPASRIAAALQRHILSISLTFCTRAASGLHPEDRKHPTKCQSELFQVPAATGGAGSSAVAQAVRKGSGCRARCIIGLIYSYQHGTWFESSITVTSHSGVCMLQRASKLERNLPPAAEHYITINRKQAESSRRSPSLACTVTLMEMYTHSSICTYYGACQPLGLHCKKESRAKTGKIWAKSFKTLPDMLRFLHELGSGRSQSRT